MLELISDVIPLASSFAGGAVGILQGSMEAKMRLRFMKAESEAEERKIHALRGEGQDVRDHEVQIEETESEKFYGFKLHGKEYGIYLKEKERDVVTSLATTVKWAVVGLLAYTYCYVVQLFAGQPHIKATTLLPSAGESKREFLGFSSTTITQYLADLSNQGIAYGMCQPILMVVFYIIMKTPFNHINQRSL
ncbi:MAG: hypothetical protein JRJ68_03225 [Deltaproteobacteria bacterium]|nr:hypothetical protein [Deltaproteobacteria bacterium]